MTRLTRDKPIFPFSPWQSFYILGMVPDPPSSKQPLHASNYHVGCLFVQKRSPPCTRAGVVGKETGVRVPCVYLFSSCMSPTYVGVCERDTNLDIMCRPSPCLRLVRPQSPPRPTPPHLISHLSPSIFIYKGALSKLQFADIQGH